MPETIAAVVAWASTPAVVVGTTTVLTYGNLVAAALVVGSTLVARDAAKAQAAAARRAYNASLQDRDVMLQTAIAARQVVYGRARVSGPIVYAESTGAKKEFLHLVIALAGHEIDAVEEIWFGDTLLPTLDGSGFVPSGSFAKSVTASTQQSSSSTSIVLSNTPTRITGVSYLVGPDLYNGSGGELALTTGYTLSGSTITIVTPFTSAVYTVNYEYAATALKRVRIKTYLGAAGQVADADLVSESAGQWTADHTGDGIAYLYVRLEYDTDVFGQIGVPNISAVIRGKKVYDPRFDAALAVQETRSAVAGTPGTPPTGWLVNAASGLTSQIVGAGYDEGLPYLDVRISGTASALTYPYIAPMAENTSGAAAAAGQSWAGGMHIKLAAGSLTGVAAVMVAVSSYTSGGAFVAAASSASVTPTTGSLKQQRVLRSAYTLPATTAYAGLYAYLQVNNGSTVDVTLRVAFPTLWQTTNTADVIAFSDNAALCAADYLRDATYGLGSTTAEVPAAEISAAANICDEEVSLYITGTADVTNGSAAVVGTGTAWAGNVNPRHLFVGPGGVDSKLVLSVQDDTHLTLVANYAGATASGAAYSVRQARYTCNGTIDSAAGLRDNLETLVDAMAGSAVWVQGRWLVRAGAHTASVLTITESMLAGDAVRIMPRTARRNLINAVTGVFIDPAANYAQKQFPSVENATYLAEDASVRQAAELMLPMTDDSVAAQRLGKIMLERARQALTVQLDCNLAAYDLAPSDVVTLTLERYGFAAKDFWVAEREVDLASGVVKLTLRETASGVWAWNYGDATTIDLAPNTALPNAFDTPAAITGLAVASGSANLQVMNDGTVIARAKLTWTASTDAFVTSGGKIEVQWKRDSDTAWQDAPTVPGDSTFAYVAALDARSVVLFRVRPVTVVGRQGAWATITHVVQADTTAPANVASLAYSNVAGGLRISWTAATESDYLETELRHGASWGAGTFIWAGSASEHTWPTATDGSYTIWAVHRDTTGNESTAQSLSITVAAVTPLTGPVDFGGYTSGTRLATGTPATADVRLKTTGEVQDSSNGGSYTNRSAWYQGTVSGTYSVRAEVTGSALASGSTSTWEVLSSDRTWGISQPAVTGEKDTMLSLSVRNDSTNVIVSLGVWNLLAYYEA